MFMNNVSAETGPLGWGEGGYKQELETDRPDFTEGAQTVQSGHLQLEFGYTFSKDDQGQVDVEEHTAPEVLARIGLIEDLELRIAWEGYASSRVDNSKKEGVTDFSLGFKHRMYRQEGVFPDFSFIGELNIPVGSSDFTSDEVEVAGKFIWAYSLELYSIAGNINFGTPIGEEGRYLEVSKSVALAFDLTEKIGTYFEYFGLYPVEDVVETTEHFLNGGFTYGISDNIQLGYTCRFWIKRSSYRFLYWNRDSNSIIISIGDKALIWDNLF